MHKVTKRIEKRINFVLDSQTPSRLHSKQTETTVKCTHELSIVEKDDPSLKDLNHVSSDLLKF